MKALNEQQKTIVREWIDFKKERSESYSSSLDLMKAIGKLNKEPQDELQKAISTMDCLQKIFGRIDFTFVENAGYESMNNKLRYNGYELEYNQKWEAVKYLVHFVGEVSQKVEILSDYVSDLIEDLNKTEELITNFIKVLTELEE